MHFPHCHLFFKATVTLRIQQENLEAMKTEMNITDTQLQSWMMDINAWAEGRL